jgi:hypothetical protein
VLHHVSAGVIWDKIVAHTMSGKFPSCKARALITWAGFINPDMNIEAIVKSRVDRGKSRAIIDKGKPSRVTVGKNIYRFAMFFFGYVFYYLKAVKSYSLAKIRVFIGNGLCFKPRGFPFLGQSPCMAQKYR